MSKTNKSVGSARSKVILLVAACILAVGWLIAREFGAGSWRHYQRQFRDAYSQYLGKQLTQRTAEEQPLYASAEYQKLEATLKDKPAEEAQASRVEFIKSKLPGLTAAELKDLQQKAQQMAVKPREWHLRPTVENPNYVAGSGLVDRCQTCHVAADPSVVPAGIVLTRADLGMEGAKDAPFFSHPEPELLKFHPPEKFGCSSCHGGNGGAIDTVAQAHGQDGNWPTPIYAPENYEAGCQQCHAQDMHTEYAPALNRGRELLRRNGCVACHVYKGFDREDERDGVRQLTSQLQADRQARMQEVARLQKLGDQAKSNQDANRAYQQATDVTLQVSNIDSQLDALRAQANGFREIDNKIGPDLTEAPVRLRKEWIPYWIQHTREFRSGTKMPQFRFKPGEAEAIAAFVWQTGVKGPPLPKQAPGDPARGKKLFETRGCLGCHSIGEAASAVGGKFAGNLSREGEKANYDYLVRFILDPRLRTEPYCPRERKSIGPEDYEKHDLPFVFDLEHDRCPNDGAILTVLRPSVMPVMRLSVEEARDIASFLMAQKHVDMKYEPAPYMDDPKLYEKGMELTRTYGCEACHSGPIPLNGYAASHPVGIELTNQGSKTSQKLDFGPLADKAKQGVQPDGSRSPRGSWYDLKGFLDHKLTAPWLYDKTPDQVNPADRLHMPLPDITTESDVNALTTLLLGSKTPPLPKEYQYKPADWRAAAIQDGWWIISKYNCTGCHQITPGQRSILMDLPMYQGEEKAKLPPILIGEGARVTPQWLTTFLHDPSLSSTQTHVNGVRSYLDLRMPNFHLTDDQIRSLVLFFQAMAGQDEFYVPQDIKPLTVAESAMARQIFTSTAAPCLKCHATGDSAHDSNATAPNFLLAKGRLQPAWTIRWLTAPELIMPGTAMPSGLFHRDRNRWVLSGSLPVDLQNYRADHADLLTRYMFQMTPDEQHRLIADRRGSASNGN